MKKKGIIGLICSIVIVMLSLSFAMAVSAATPAKQNISKVANTKSGVKVTWTKSSNAEGYKIYRKENGGSWQLLKTIRNRNTLSYLDKTAVNGKLYYYTVRGYIGSKNSSYNKTGLPVFRLRTPYSIAKCISNAPGQVTLVWDKNGSASGTQIIYSRSSDFSDSTKLKVSGSQKNTVTIKNLSEGIKYYFKIQFYRTVGKKNYFSSFPAMKSTTVSKQAVPSFVRTGRYVYRYPASVAYPPMDVITVESCSNGTITFFIEHTGVNGSPLYAAGKITAKMNGNSTEVFQWKDTWANSGTGKLIFSNNAVEAEMSYAVTSRFNRWGWWDKSPKMIYEG